MSTNTKNAGFTAAKVKSEHQRLIAHARTHQDSYGNGNNDPERVGYDALRSEIHAALQVERPAPGPAPEDEGDPELLHARQKAHNKALWKETDAIIAAAGIAAPPELPRDPAETAPAKAVATGKVK